MKVAGGCRVGDREKGTPQFSHNMVLLWRADANMQAGSNTVTCEGEGDVMKFLFVYENVIMRRKSNEEKACQLLCHLIDSEFNFYFATYSQDGVLVEAASDWTAVRESLIGRSAVDERPEEDIQRAITGRLDEQNLEVSLFVGMDRTLLRVRVTSNTR